MSERYYSTSDNYPYVIKSILERVILYFQNVIYPDESLTDSRKRFILADTSDDGNAIRRSIDFFKNSNGTFPFTAYNIQDDAPGEFKSHLQVSGKVYSELVGGYISFVPMVLNIPMVTYYTTPFDFWRGMTIFADDEANLSRLDTPVIINGVTCSMTIDLTYTTERGSLAFSIEEHFGVGKIYPVLHTVDVKCAYIVVNMTDNPTTGANNQPVIVYPVDDIIFYLSEIQDSRNVLIDTKHSPDNPEVLSSTPTSEATGVALDSSIVLTFNVAMNETLVYNNIDIVPTIDKDMSFDLNSKVLTIVPRSNLTASTSYNILINTNAKSYDDLPLEEDYSLTFTTGTV